MARAQIDPKRAVASMDKLLGRSARVVKFTSDFILYCKIVADACKRYLGVVYSDVIVQCKASDPLVQRACQSAIKLALSKRMTLYAYVQQAVTVLRLHGFPQGDHKRDPFIAVGSKSLLDKLDTAYVFEERYTPSVKQKTLTPELVTITDNASDVLSKLLDLPHRTAEAQRAWLVACRGIVHPVVLFACEAVHDAWAMAPTSFHPQMAFYAAKYRHTTLTPSLREIVAWRGWETHCTALCHELALVGA